ncbi:CCA tRNA nucleotidyltransferase [Candidatus Falkowbacteria bacterium]|nr:CCA tRNA nucleotidyltransferase [Candidatus Falkowbacteria bacterium]
MKKNRTAIYETRLGEFREKMEQDPSLGFAKELLSAFPQSEIYLVGGAVRDAALGEKKQKDYDFVVRNVLPETLEKFLKERGEVVLVGRNFGVYKFVPKDFKLEEAFDIALPRTEHSLGAGGGYRDFKVQSDPKMTMEEDLGRRDFTVNTMALDLKDGKLVDPFHGLEDLDAKVLRAVGEPQERFKEDYSRMLRALRFAAQFGFTIEGKTFLAIQDMIKNINDERQRGGKKERVVPYETIAKELLKAFWRDPVRALELYESSGALYELMPELFSLRGCEQPPNFHSEGDVWTHTKMALANLYSERFKKQFGEERPSAEVVMAVLFHDLGKPLTLKTPERDGTDRIRFDGHDVAGAEAAGKICRRLKLDSLPEGSPIRVDPKRVEQMIGKHMLLLQGEIEGMKPSTIEKYFFNPNFPGDGLLQLTFADALATIPKVGEPDLENFYTMVKRIEGLKSLVKEKNRLPKPILSGDEIMKRFKLKPDPKVGELIKVLREAQLSGEVGAEDDPIKERKKKGFKILEKYLESK